MMVPAILLFRDAERSGGHDTNPKFAVDALTFNGDSSSAAAPWSWMLDLPTSDASGYAASILGKEVVAMGDYLMVIGPFSGVLMTKDKHGIAHVEDWKLGRSTTTPVAFDVLTPELEWRRANIPNAWTLGAAKAFKMLHCPESNCCWLVQASSVLVNSHLSVHVLHRVSSLPQVLDHLSVDQLQSKRISLRYQLEKAEKLKALPLRQCACCAVLESPATRFKLCAACKVAAYCGARCQKQHWKDGHKLACAGRATTSTQAPSTRITSDRF